jgi:hypothetical protein
MMLRLTFWFKVRTDTRRITTTTEDKKLMQARTSLRKVSVVRMPKCSKVPSVLLTVRTVAEQLS